MKQIYLIIFLIIAFTNATFAQWESCSNGLGDPWAFALSINSNNLYFGGNGIYVSTDNGDTWTEKFKGLDSNIFVYSFVFSGKYIYAGTDVGVFISDNNGFSWYQNVSNINGILVTSLAIENNNIYAGTWGKCLFISSDNGNNWTKTNTGIDTIITSIKTKGNNIFAASWGGGVILSSDNGNSWSKKNTGLTNLWINTMEIKDTSIFVGTDLDGIFRSDNNADNWKIINSGITNLEIRSITTNGNLSFAGSDGIVFLSSDNGNNWAATKDTGFTTYTSINNLVINNNYIFAGTNDGVYRAKLNDFITDVDEQKLNFTKNNFDISPNPASDYIQIKNYYSEITNIKIYNQLGEEMNIKPSQGFKTFEGLFSNINIYIANIPNGIYYCKINSGNNKINKKFIVLK